MNGYIKLWLLLDYLDYCPRPIIRYKYGKEINLLAKVV